MSYASDMSYVNNMGYVNNISYVNYMSIFMNHLQSNSFGNI